MAVVSYPGVYVEEVSSGVRPIATASTSTAAFIGEAERGSLTEAVRIFNFTQFQNLYGGFLPGRYLAHSVFQFFNNGGSICYIVRVAGANTETANIVINDRGTAAQPAITVSAVSPGVWGNGIELRVTNGTNNPGNEFNLEVFTTDTPDPVERFENLSMVPDAPNFVSTVTGSSIYIRIAVNPTNTNAGRGSSVGSAAALGLTAPRTRLQINIDGDGYQEVDLQDAVPGTVADLSTPGNIALAMTTLVQALTPQRATTATAAFSAFTATQTAGVLTLQSGAAGVASSVNVARASSAAQDATGLLSLGSLQGGTEVLGGAVTRPALQDPAVPRYLVGDQALPAAGVASVLAGRDGDPITTDVPYTNAFQRLDDKNDVSLISVPGIGSAGVVGEGMNYCDNRSLRDCFYIGDTALDVDTVPEAQALVGSISPKNSYGAVYMPWLLMSDPTVVSPDPIQVPPSGFVAGMYAKTDARRGVWKAPAGTASALAGARGLTVNLTDVQQGLLNPSPINLNVIRQFAASGTVIWGARTITSDPEYLYVPVRRMAIMLRVSIYRGIQWAVFEPNDEPLWAQLRLNITAFMNTLFRQGAFQGATSGDAFFVKVDSETTTQDDINLGIVNVLVGFAPLKPAEFVVVKISQKAGQAS